jgi:hypothetical protein
MGQAIGYHILGKMNKLFNQLGDNKAVEPIERYLDKLVTNGTIVRWERNESGRGWVVYDSSTSDGIYIDWNSRENVFVGPGHEPTPKDRVIPHDKRWEEKEK